MDEFCTIYGTLYARLNISFAIWEPDKKVFVGPLIKCVFVCLGKGMNWSSRMNSNSVNQLFLKHAYMTKKFMWNVTLLFVRYIFPSDATKKFACCLIKQCCFFRFEGELRKLGFFFFFYSSSFKYYFLIAAY